MRIAAVLVVVAACSSSPEEMVGDEPRLEVLTPERGTMSEETTLVVSGRVTNLGDRVSVTVNGVAASVVAGAFEATLEVPPGLAILETRASGTTELRDARAVLVGPTAPVGGRVDDGLAARIGVDGFATVGDAIANAVETIDFTAAGQAVNPVYENTGCLGAVVNITAIDVGGVDVGLVPTSGALSTDVSLTNVVVHLHASYEVACLGGSRDLTVSASRVRVRGSLGVGLAGGDLATSLGGLTVAFENFDLDVNGLPGSVVNLFNGIVDDRVAAALADAIRARVPPFADAALSDLAAKSYTVSLLGREVGVHASPSQLTLDATGAFVSVDTQLSVDGGNGASYLATPRAATAAMLAGERGLAIAVADDAVNQLFAGLWAAGALDQELAPDGTIPVTTLLDDETATVELSLALPPTMSTSESVVHLGFGDVLLTGRDAAGEILQQFAISVTTTLAAATAPGGRIELAIGPPRTWAQVLVQTDRVERELDAELLENLVASVWRIVGDQASRALAEMPLPSVGGVAATDPAVRTADGYVVVRADLVMP
jgi:hypothetical protein